MAGRPRRPPPPPYSRQSPRMREAVGQMLRTEYADEMELLERFQRARDGLGPWGTPCCSRTRPSRSRPNRYGRSSRSTSR
ncbi:hypothetical protein ACFQHO_33005 [Actinomadura yumaensis]|uniref:hypothetical protein n=1 Tax=Actinomadura yumaensis TaxID=111807 RepID=UPI003617ADCA